MPYIKSLSVILFLIFVPIVSGWAEGWSNQDLKGYVGTWEGRSFPAKFSYAKNVELSLWLNAQKELKGAVLFSKKKRVLYRTCSIKFLTRKVGIFC